MDDVWTWEQTRRRERGGGSRGWRRQERGQKDIAMFSAGEERAITSLRALMPGVPRPPDLGCQRPVGTIADGHGSSRDFFGPSKSDVPPSRPAPLILRQPQTRSCPLVVREKYTSHSSTIGIRTDYTCSIHTPFLRSCLHILAEHVDRSTWVP